MKRYLLVLILLLSSCSSATTETAPIKSFAPCSSIQSTGMNADGLMLECLDGEGELAVQAIEGPAVITVWASWCTNCEAQRPNFIKLYEESKGRFQVVGIDVEEKSKADGYEHAWKKGMSYPHLFDRTGSTANYFGPGVPITQVITADGQLAFQKVGPIFTYEEMQQLMDEYLGIKV